MALRGWPVVRIGYPVAVFVLLAATGGWRLITHEDGFGLVEVIAGGVALAFLPRRGLPAAVAIAVVIDGLIGWRLWEAVGGLVAVVMLALPAPRREVEDLDAAQGEQLKVSPQVGPALVEPAIRIRTIGGFELWSGGEDHAPQLFANPALTFLWLYLLVCVLGGGGGLSTRTSVAAELYPSERLEERRRANLRKRLLALRTMTGPFKDLLVEDGRDLVGLRLDGTRVDFQDMRDLRDRCHLAGSILEESLLEEAEAELSRIGILEFLAGWEDWEQIQTSGKGTAGSLVRQLRRQLDDWRADVALAVAQTRIARGEASRCVALVEAALERSPEREDLAATLTAAYARTGQIGRAADVRSDYSLKEA